MSTVYAMLKIGSSSNTEFSVLLENPGLHVDAAESLARLVGVGPTVRVGWTAPVAP